MIGPQSRMLAPVLPDAACVGVDTNLFYSYAAETIARAKVICSSCPERAACAEWAMQNEEYGVWGGLDENERRELRRMRRRSA